MTDRVVRYFDLARLHESMRPELDAAFDAVVRSSGFVGSAASAAFEEEFSRQTGRTHTIGVGSGTDALTLSLIALGIGPGDQVLVPANTFVATAEAVVHAGAEPVFVDVEPDSLLISQATVAEALTSSVTAIMPVHLFGHVVPLDAIDAWRASGLTVVEDAAQAHLATWQGREVGSAGQTACYSFYPGKNLGALGDGGAVTTDDVAIAERLRQLRDHGRVSGHEHGLVGFCTRLDGMQSGFLLAKMAHLSGWTAKRVAIAERYRELLSDVKTASLVPWEDGAVHHLIVVRVKDRDGVAARLAAAGVETGVHYRLAVTQQSAFAKWSRACPNAEQAAGEILSLPCDPLMTDDEIAYVCESLARATA